MPISATKSQKALDDTAYSSNVFWKPKPKAGTGEFENNFVRILPNPNLTDEDGDTKLFLPVSLHWPPEGAGWNAFICPRSENRECPVCNAGFAELRRLKATMPEKDARAACRHYWPSWAQYFTVVVLNEDGSVSDDEPKILSANRDLAGLLLDELWDTDGCPGCGDENEEHLSSCIESEDGKRMLDYTDLSQGFDVNIRTKENRDGGYLKHDYAIKRRRKVTAFDHPEILEAVPNPLVLNPTMEHSDIAALLTPEGQLALGPGAPGGGSDPLEPAGTTEGEFREVPEEETPEPENEWGDDKTSTAEAPEAEQEGPEQEETPAKPPAKKAPAKRKAAAKKPAAKPKNESAEEVQARKDALKQQLSQG